MVGFRELKARQASCKKWVKEDNPQGARHGNCCPKARRCQAENGRTTEEVTVLRKANLSALMIDTKVGQGYTGYGSTTLAVSLVGCYNESLAKVMEQHIATLFLGGCTIDCSLTSIMMTLMTIALSCPVDEILLISP